METGNAGGCIMEITPEDLQSGLNRYSTILTAVHMNNAESSFYATPASAIKLVLYSLGILNDLSNSEIVDDAKRAAEKRKLKLQKIRQGK
jgi:hypothetical protein